MNFENYLARRASPQAAVNERVLITGGSGFIGTNLVDFYREAPGYSALSIDIKPPRNGMHKSLYRRADVLKFDEVSSIIQDFRPTVVFHLAARADLDGKSVDDYPANTLGVENMIRATRRMDIKPRMTVFASSRIVCKTGYIPTREDEYLPTTAYGESKVRTEQIVRSMAGTAFNWVLVRPTAIWGPWFGVPYRVFFDTVQHGRYLHPKGMRIPKSFGFVGNMVYQLDRLAFAGESLAHRTIYLCDYEPLDVYEWAVLISQSFNRRAPYQVPMSVLRTIATLGDLVERATGRHAPLTSFRLSNLTTQMVHDSDPVRTIAPTLPFSAADGVDITTRWVRAERNA
jgi:nucleoside-diphosphate-sugar epimerase